MAAIDVYQAFKQAAPEVLVEEKDALAALQIACPKQQHLSLAV